MSGGDDFIRVNLGGEYGMSRKGKPVFNKFVHSKHVAKEIIQPIRGIPIILGMDFGLTPATALMQVTGRGVRILDELPATDETLEDYLNEYLQPLLLKKYQGYSIVASGDPSGSNRDRHTKQSDFSILRGAKIRAYEAITNNIEQRIAVVNWFLSRDEGFLISPHCTHLIEGMAGGYVFKEAKNAVGQPTDIPLKNEYSHVCDAVQYGCLYARYGNRTTQGQTKQPDKKPFLYA